MVTYTIYLISNGMTAGTRDGRLVGRLDLPVCMDGIKELNQLFQNNEYPKVRDIYIAPLERCKNTADILFPNSYLTIVDDLNDLSLGDFEGKLIEDLGKDEIYVNWLKNSRDNTPPNALETSEEFSERVAKAFNQIIMNMSSNHVMESAIVAPSFVIMSIMSRFALPHQPMGKWITKSGCGYTVRTSTQMWMRDETFEILGNIPTKK